MKNKSKKYRMIYSTILFVMVVLLMIFRSSFGMIFVIGNIFMIWLLILLSKKYTETGHRFVKWIRAIGIIGYSLFILSFIFVESFILYELQECKKLNLEEIDVVVILGAGLRGAELSKTLELRLKAGSEFLTGYEEVPVIVSGGQGPGETITEAEAMGKYLTQHGIKEDRIYYENQSTSTYENLKFSKRIMEELRIQHPTVLIVTSDYHTVRATMIANELGIKSECLSSDSPFFIKVNYFIREYFALVKHYVTKV